MTRLLPLLTVLLLGACYRLAAQEIPLKVAKPKARQIWIGVGWSDWSIRDDAYAPGGVYKAGMTTLRIGHTREQGQWINFTEGMIGLGRLQTAQNEAFDSLLLPVRGPVIQVGSTHKGMQLKGEDGMRYRTGLTLLETMYYPRYARPGLVSSTTLGPEIGFEPTQRHGATISLRLSIPLIGWLTRWHKDPKGEGKPEKVKKFSGVKSMQTANLSLHGQYFFNKSLSAGFQWRLSSLAYRRNHLLQLKENAWYTYVAVHY